MIALFAAVLAFAFTATAPEYKVNTTKSKIEWVGRKVTGEHRGAITISAGKLSWDGKKLTGGSFDIDMSSITNTDITDAEYNKQLIGHLQSEDFFSTAKYPKASFVITKVVPQAKNAAIITGDLTIKGITKQLAFPAVVQASENEVTATATITVDRTLYDIKYGSGSFFDNLGDKAIDNEFELNVALVATKNGIVK